MTCSKCLGPHAAEVRAALIQTPDGVSRRHSPLVTVRMTSDIGLRTPDFFCVTRHLSLVTALSTRHSSLGFLTPKGERPPLTCISLCGISHYVVFIESAAFTRRLRELAGDNAEEVRN